ncbi:SDR family oxidoreductase [Streptomyces olivochromogenes]|uniref:SDR family oxidoreductase n=1 Tax=Streptomyces olivochromogenes TaxID=1963 RepID=UPI001F3DF222|nr:SDR family oxidoreductase [Streptomyces olivochromogenes]MCF3136752.1 SDR family oxidoreductase [Streptomyces olivochromogenes]
MGDLKGKTALVTGASRGIGRGIARRLAADGALVAVHYATKETAAEETAELIARDGGRAFLVRTPLGTPGDVPALYARLDAALEEHGEPRALDILVNNAGYNIPGAIGDVTPQDFDQLVAVHAKAPLFLIQHGLGRLREGGRIVNISSAATRVAFPGSVAYSMAKGALESLTLALAKELGSRGITVNAVAPGYVKTDMNRQRWSTPEKEAAHAALSVFGRMGDVGDIADIVAFLASDESRWITGQCIDASGGVNL